MKEFSKSLTFLSSLQILEIYVPESEDFDSRSMMGLTRDFDKLSSLQNLRLCFESCYNVCDEGLIHLAQALSRLHTLIKLSLDFEQIKLAKKIFTIF